MNTCCHKTFVSFAERTKNQVQILFSEFQRVMFEIHANWILVLKSIMSIISMNIRLFTECPLCSASWLASHKQSELILMLLLLIFYVKNEITVNNIMLMEQKRWHSTAMVVKPQDNVHTHRCGFSFQKGIIWGFYD